MTNKQHVLVTFYDNWADEVDFEGFCVFTEEEWQQELDSLIEGAFPLYLYFGTNEDNEYSSKQDLLSRYKVTPITEEQANTLQELFKGRYGEFPRPSVLMQHYLEEQEEYLIIDEQDDDN